MPADRIEGPSGGKARLETVRGQVVTEILCPAPSGCMARRPRVVRTYFNKKGLRTLVEYCCKECGHGFFVPVRSPLRPGE